MTKKVLKSQSAYYLTKVRVQEAEIQAQMMWGKGGEFRVSLECRYKSGWNVRKGFFSCPLG